MPLNPVIERLSQTPELLRDNWCLPPDVARFLYLLTRSARVTRMLEVGTSIGYSSLHLAQAAAENNGHLTSIDSSTERQAQAAQYLNEARLATHVTLLTGDALTMLETLRTEGRTFDFMFLDARKSEYIDYLHRAEGLLTPGGLLLADNTRSHRDEMSDFIASVTGSPGWIAADLDTSNGFILARKQD